MRKLSIVLTCMFIALFTMGNTGCDENTSREQGAQVREGIMQRANKVAPVPEVHNYPSRQAVIKQVKRMDQVGKLYYVYLMADNGTQIGFFVVNTRPVNVCAALTPVDDINGTSSNYVVTRAPGIQGTYGSGNCDNSFTFDAATDALIEYPTRMGVILDAPLMLKSDPIRVVAAAK